MLKVNFTIEESADRKSLFITDTTGIYHGTLNPGGYGAPNPTVAMVLTATLGIVIPQGSNPIVVNIFEATVFPNTGNVTKEVLASDFGLLEFPDGIYQMTYSVTGDDAMSVAFVSTKTITKGFLGAVQCCVDKLGAKAAQTEECSCCDEKTLSAKFLAAYTMLRSALKAEHLGNIACFEKLLERLEKICDDTDCGCGH